MSFGSTQNLQAVKECREAVSLMLEMQRTDDKRGFKKGGKKPRGDGCFFLDMDLFVGNLKEYA